MTHRNNEFTVTTVQSGHTLTNEIDLRGMRSIGFFMPAITSCQAFLQVAPGVERASATSAQFVRMTSPLNTNSVWAWNVGPGSAAAMVGLDLPFAFGRLEFAVSQQNLITVTVVGKRIS